MCVFLHKSSCPQFSTKQKISISYFWRPEYINPKMTEKSVRVLSDEGRVNWWSRHQVSTCWSTPAVIYDSRRRIRCILGHLWQVCARRRPHESVCSVYPPEHLLCFVKWNLNRELPQLYELINRSVSHWLLHHFEDVFNRQELEEPLWSVQVKLPLKKKIHLDDNIHDYVESCLNVNWFQCLWGWIWRDSGYETITEGRVDLSRAPVWKAVSARFDPLTWTRTTAENIKRSEETL